MRAVLVGEYIKSHREKQRITQEELCAGICSKSTLSRLERGKQTPGRDKLCALLHRLGLPEDRVFVVVSEHDAEIQKLKKSIKADVIEFEKMEQVDRPQLRERFMAKLNQMEALVDEDDVINRQYILSTQVTLGTPDGPYTPAQRRRLLEKAIRMTVPGFQLAKVESFRYRLEEMTLLNMLARTFSMEGKREEATDLYRRLLQNIEKNSCEMEDYGPIFCLVAYNYAINLTLAGEYNEALSLAERGQQTSIHYSFYLFFPGFLATQAECWFFLGNREKSVELYIRAGYLLDVIGNKYHLDILRKEMREHLKIDPPF